MKTLKSFLCLFLILLISLALFVHAGAEESGDSGDQSGGYNGYVVKYGYKPLVAPDGTKASNYIEGSTPATAYVPAGGSHTVAKNEYTFRDYVFVGWACGDTLYQPGEVIYNVTSNLTLIATWSRGTVDGMKVVGVLTYAGDEAVSLEVGTVTQLKEGKWQDDRGRIFEGGSNFLLSFTSAELKKYSGKADTVKVSYDGNGISDGVQCSFSAEKDKGFTVDGCYGKRDGYNFIGWKDANGRIYLPGDTCLAEGDTAFTAMWQESTKPAPDYCSVTLSAGEGGTVSPNGKVTVIKGEIIEFSVTAEEGYSLKSVLCDGAELGVGGSYKKTINGDMAVFVSFEKLSEPPMESEPESKPVESSPDSSTVEEPTVEVSDETESDTPAGNSATPAEKPAKADKKSDGGDKDDRSIIIILLCVLFIVIGGWFAAITVLNKKKKRKKKRKK